MVPLGTTERMNVACKSSFLAGPSSLIQSQRRPTARSARRMSTKAILEKAREIVAPSNGVPLDWKPKTDPASVQADVLQNLGMQLKYAALHIL